MRVSAMVRFGLGLGYCLGLGSGLGRFGVRVRFWVVLGLGVDLG